MERLTTALALACLVAAAPASAQTATTIVANTVYNGTLTEDGYPTDAGNYMEFAAYVSAGEPFEVVYSSDAFTPSLVVAHEGTGTVIGGEGSDNSSTLLVSADEAAVGVWVIAMSSAEAGAVGEWTLEVRSPPGE